MKKYKLIKEYPGCQLSKYKVGDIVTQFEFSGSKWYNKSGDHRELCLLQSSVEDYPEFWEEVIEKRDWEIVELRKVDKSNYTKERRKIENYLKSLEYGQNIYWFIHSIKRLSDGEVFTVGDRIDIGKITIIEYRKENKPSPISTEIWLRINERKGVALSIAKKEYPLLKTEDGADLYEGDQYWTVFDKVSSEIKPFTLYGPHRLKRLDTEIEEESFDFVSCKYFAQFDNATKYIQENKPKTLYGVNGSFTKTATSLANKIKQDYSAGDWKWFNSEKEREIYIEENQPRFSLKDVKEFCLASVDRFKYCAPSDTSFKAWFDLQTKGK